MKVNHSIILVIICFLTCSCTLNDRNVEFPDSKLRQWEKDSAWTSEDLLTRCFAYVPASEIAELETDSVDYIVYRVDENKHIDPLTFVIPELAIDMTGILLDKDFDIEVYGVVIFNRIKNGYWNITDVRGVQCRRIDIIQDRKLKHRFTEGTHDVSVEYQPLLEAASDFFLLSMRNTVFSLPPWKMEHVVFTFVFNFEQGKLPKRLFPAEKEGSLHPVDPLAEELR